MNAVKRLIALILTWVMVIGLFPAGVLAAPDRSNLMPLTAGAPGIALTDIATVAVQSVTSDGSVVDPDTGTVERDQRIGINIRFVVDDQKLVTAKANIPWIYDVSDSVGNSKIFSQLVANEEGVLLNGTATVGTYTVTADGMVKLTPDSNWLERQSSGVAGSSKVGANCILAGQVGVVGHIEVGDNVTIAAQSGVTKNVKSNNIMLGSPALPADKMRKIYVYERKLEEMAQRIAELERLIKS